jgi:hypothetical protein
MRGAVALCLLATVLAGPAGPAGDPYDLISGPPVPGPGYHHLGASTHGAWAGVQGRMSVTAAGVRDGTYDFVATRFMVKSEVAGATRWLEAGWAQTGWSGLGRQRVYTYDTDTNTWTFYDQYPLSPGDQIWINLVPVPDGRPRHGPSAGPSTGPSTAADPSAAGPPPAAERRPGGGTAWAAWLWWHGDWHLLATRDLPIGERATVEQYVEVYVDPERGGAIPVPPVQVDNVQVRADPAGPGRFWDTDVPTDPGTGTDSYCLTWQKSFDTWQAGSCAGPTTGIRPG